MACHCFATGYRHATFGIISRIWRNRADSHTSFTPNDDGKNPVFLPIFSYPDEIEEYRMEIYNRWGGLVFRTEEKSFGWDGANAMDGVYAVVLHYKSRGDKPKTAKGTVTLVR